MTADILDPSALLSRLPTLLPETSQKLASPHDGIVTLLHTTMATLGFRLIGIDDSSPAQSDLNNILPPEWNKNGPSHYTLRYKHDQSSLEFILKVTKLGPRTLINAIAVESDKAESLDISTNDFISQSFYPHDVSAADAQPLVHGFISFNRVTDLISQFKLKIIQKLVPGLRKEGYTEDDVQHTNSTEALRQPQSQAQPQLPRYNPEEDYYRTPSSSQSHIPPYNPLEIGRRDLDPIPHNPFAPPPLFPGGGDGDGMFVGPNHPIFSQGGRGLGRRDPTRGPWGGDGFLPPMGAPQGARFDPIGPGPLGPFPGLGRSLGGRGRGGHFPGSGDPDNDEFMPPGSRDMFM